MARTDPQVNFRMPADLKERLEEAAKKHGRSVTQEIIQRLERSFALWGAPDGPDTSAPDWENLQELVDNLPPPDSEKDAIATQLALAVLRMTGRISDIEKEGRVLDHTSRDALLKPLESVLRPTEDPNPARTPKIPGTNAPKEGIGAVPRAEKPKPGKKKVTE
ncbi:Arc family DNA-binding protein [Bordetella bronchiseptica]|uniref:Arc family DNA-binding protein n=1 Tax=Bordetella bronchiseptica TaxID=518 RepID=UPI00052918AD|nr:Arc family DNA-binding protein [Bordetella bronchiseptica]SHS99788.1 Arc-like DNA binding domain [Mycobacteroides abscessus subsp. abscessus]